MKGLGATNIHTEGKFLILLTLFILGVLLGFLLDMITVDKIGLTPFPQMLTHHVKVPQKLKWFQQWNIFQETINKSMEASSAILKEPLSAQMFWRDGPLFNVTQFYWTRNNESICDVNSSDHFILPVLVHTARPHFAERLTIRKSWGSVPIYKNWSVRLIFLLGEADRGADPSKNEAQYLEQEQSLDEEHSKYGDVITGNFVDTYKNLTYKHMMGFRWILNFCQNATFVLKIDDDMFIDIIKFIDWRTEDLNPEKNRVDNTDTPVPDLYCNTFVGTKPQRCVGCKWYASELEWADDYYPDYCSGWAYGITVNWISKLYSTIPSTNFFWVDDVYATGVLMEQYKKEHKKITPSYKHLWGQVRGLDFRNFRPMCEKNDLTMTRKFGAVVPIARGSNFDRDIMCLWNKTLYDANLLEIQR